MRISSCLFFCLFTLHSVIPQLNENSCNMAVWENIKLVSEPIPDSLSKVLVVTNRPFLPDNEDKKYLPNKIADYRKVTYIVAGCKGDDWYIRKVDSFKEGMKTTDNGKDILLFIHGHGKEGIIFILGV